MAGESEAQRARVLKKGGFLTIGSGRNRDHLVYISDLVDALRLAGEAPGVDGEAFNIGAAEAVTLKELFAEVRRQLTVPGPVGHLPSASYYAFNWLAERYYALTGRELPRVHRYGVFLADQQLDITKARRMLGYEPKVDLAQGMHLTIGWFREAGSL